MSSVPPPPPPSSPTPPPPPSPTPPPPSPTPPPAPSAWSQPPAAPPATEAGLTTKPPRPKVQLGAILTLVGGALLFIGAFLPWLKVSGQSLSGMDDFLVESEGDLKIFEAPGRLWIFGAVVLLGLGLALLLAGRILAVAIIGIVTASLSLFFVLAGWGAASDSKDFAGEGSYQFGLILGTIGAFAALAGTIAATSKRRR